MPPQALVEWWIKTGLIYGLGFVFAAAILGIFVVFVASISRKVVVMVDACRVEIPRVAKAHLDFVQTTKENGYQITAAVQAIRETYSLSTINHERTHRALGQIVAAAHEAAAHINNEKVRSHLGQAAKELERQ